MLKSYLKIVLRNIKRHKGYSSINITGLALGMACCLLITIWILDELSYDKFHGNAANLYRVEENQHYSGRVFHVNVTPYPLAPALKDEIPDIIDARLADAHELVQKLKGPFDFVFCDADKGWYKNYLMAVLPKLEVGGCYTAHNVSGRSRGRMWGIGEFVDYLESLLNMETTYGDSSWSGMSISYKKSEK
jgi:putative ABC transport system permease protein